MSKPNQNSSEILRRLLHVLVGGFLMLLAVVLICTWWTQHSSCERSNASRVVVLKRAKAEMQRANIWERRGDRALASNARKSARAVSGLKLLDCDRLLPQE